jgi:hypothetical protein
MYIHIYIYINLIELVVKMASYTTEQWVFIAKMLIS